MRVSLHLVQIENLPARPLNHGLAPISSALPFTDYVRDTYNSTLLPLMAKSTRDRYEGIIRNYLEPAFGSTILRDLTPRTLQQFCSALPARLSYESRDKIRDVLSSILQSAVKYGLLMTNPAEGLRINGQLLHVCSPDFAIHRKAAECDDSGRMVGKQEVIRLLPVCR